MDSQKTILITGAASGIGRATALFFAGKGWRVGLFDISEKQLQQVAEQIGGQCVLAKVVDVCSLESVAAGVADLAQATGRRLDVLFNCAGILHMGRFDQVDFSDLRRIVDVNFTGILNVTHACLPLLKETSGARIINMSSASAVYGIPELAVYSATKFAVRGLTEALNIELEPDGIWVCDIMAPYVMTPMVTQAAVKATSVDRLGVRLTPEKIARTVWKATHGRQTHWRVGGMFALMLLSFWALPFARRTLVKSLAFKSPAKPSKNVN